MINVELSSIWNCLSLPDLLASEKDIFDAHYHLRTNSGAGNDFLGFLGLPDSATARTVHAVRTAAERIRQSGDTLVVAGRGGPFLAARAGIDLLLGRGRTLRGDRPRVLFTGDNLSGRDWLELCELLDGREFSLHLISADGGSLETCVASRAARWMMERRYGPEAKDRIYVSAAEGSPMAVMAKEEGYTFLPLPRELGGADSALSSAALLPMAAAGIEPLSLLEGAAEAYREMDVRAFENPAWLYAGARCVLSSRGRTTELLGTFDPGLASFRHWWQQYVSCHTCREGLGVLPMQAGFPGDLEGFDAMVQSGKYPLFETVLTVDMPAQQKVNVEMDWKDYDGLGYLSGKTLADTETAACEAMIGAHFEGGVPVIAVSCPEFDAVRLGELFYFFELSNAICACTNGIEPFDPAPRPTFARAEQLLGKPEA